MMHLKLSHGFKRLSGDDVLDFIVPNPNGILAFQSGFNTRVASNLEESLWQTLSLKARLPLFSRSLLYGVYCSKEAHSSVTHSKSGARLRGSMPR